MSGRRGGAPPRNRTAAARTRGNGGKESCEDVARRSYTTAKKYQQPGVQEVYDGTRHAGSLIPKGQAWLAYAADGRFLGSRASSRLAARLIYEGHRPGGTS